jgi:hypothetical protein
MKAYLLDIESVPRSESELIAMMPEELRNPIMPQEIASPEPPDLSKCPVYGGDKAKQHAWVEKTSKEWEAKTEKAKEDWQLKAGCAKQDFISSAALHAPRGQVKIIGIRNLEKKLTVCTICDATKEEIAKIRAVKLWPCAVEFNFLDEKTALDKFHDLVIEMENKSKFIGYYIAGFDFPFLLRRAMILGAKIATKLRRGRYFDNNLYIDLDEEYKMGERELKIGGLTGLSKILGVTVKEGSGEGFHRIWRDDPVAAVLYHLNEAQVIEECGRKMGVIE